MTAPTVTEARVLEALDVPGLVNSLRDLVQVPSVTGSDAESRLQHDLAHEFGQLGLDVDAWSLDVPELLAHPDSPGIEAPRSQGYGLVGISEGEGTPAIVLQGHIDVVSTGDLEKWTDRDPYSGRIVGDVLHGRGACDMKAGVAVNVAVARAMRLSRVTLDRRFALHSVVSEEDGGLGAFATLLRGHTGDAGVLTEPTSGRIVTANAGALTFRITVPGRAAHGSMRMEGFSAFEAFLPVYRALQELERVRNLEPDPLFDGYRLPYPISVGEIHAGDWASSVPDLLTADGRYGVRLGEDPAAARTAFDRAVARACHSDPWLKNHPATIDWVGGQFGSGRLDDRHPLIDEVAHCVADVTGGVRPGRGAAPYGSDLRLYSGMGGIPSLHYGPGDVRFAHAPREQVSIKETVQVARALLLLVVRRCGAH